MPLPSARQAQVFGRVGKPLPTSLAAGAPLEEIGQVLRHRRLLTTAAYTKVDIGTLRSLARPWPGAS